MVPDLQGQGDGQQRWSSRGGTQKLPRTDRSWDLRPPGHLSPTCARGDPFPSGDIPLRSQGQQQDATRQRGANGPHRKGSEGWTRPRVLPVGPGVHPPLGIPEHSISSLGHRHLPAVTSASFPPQDPQQVRGLDGASPSLMVQLSALHRACCLHTCPSLPGLPRESNPCRLDSRAAP